MPQNEFAEVGKYRIVEQIGEGAMGVVYRALDPVLNRSVAI
jgi:eukaryotic-like serine/threonine-protein kinase